MKRSKTYRAAAEKIDPERIYAPLEAVRLAKETSPTKFDATVEVALRLGVDPRKADQMVRGTVNLPHGTGKIAPRRWSSPAARRRMRPRRPGLTSWAATISSPRSRAASWTSTPPSPPLTRWPRSDGSRASSVPAA